MFLFLCAQQLARIEPIVQTIAIINSILKRTPSSLKTAVIEFNKSSPSGCRRMSFAQSGTHSTRLQSMES